MKEIIGKKVTLNGLEATFLGVPVNGSLWPPTLVKDPALQTPDKPQTHEEFAKNIADAHKNWTGTEQEWQDGLTRALAITHAADQREAQAFITAIHKAIPHLVDEHGTPVKLNSKIRFNADNRLEVVSPPEL